MASALVTSVGVVIGAAPAQGDFSPDPFVAGTGIGTELLIQPFNGATGTVPAGWTVGGTGGWAISNTAQSSGGGTAAIGDDGNIAYPGSGFIWHDDTNGGSPTLTSPVVSLATAADPYASFNVHSFYVAGDEQNQGFSTDKSELLLDVLAADGTLLDTVYKVGDTDLNGADGWLPVRVRLADFAGQDVRLRFRYVNGPVTEHDIAIDELVVVDLPAPDGTDVIEEFVSSTYFLPIPASDFTIAHSQAANAACGTGTAGLQQTATQFTSITIGDTATDLAGNPTSALVLYDHSEDGFGPISTRSQATTELWGDGDLTNGFAPGHTDDILLPGDVIVLESVSDPGIGLEAPGNPAESGDIIVGFNSTADTTLAYDAGDRLTSPTGLVITRVGWNDTTSTLLAGAVEVADTNSWGTAYEMPIGENLTISSFDYVAASIMARTDGTVVTLPDGVTTVTLDAGESHYIDGGLNVGDEITATAPISVNVLAIDECSNFQGRWFRIDPVRLFDSEYYTPVNGGGENAAVVLYNPSASSITVTVSNRFGFVSNVTVPAGATASIATNVANTGYKFESNSDFYAVQLYDDNSTTRDWGFALLGLDQLSPILQAGLALGVDPTSSDTTTVNSPIWVTPIWSGAGAAPSSVTLCIDWNGNNAPTDAPDATISLAELESRRLYGPGTTNDLTGTKIEVCNLSDPTDPALSNWLLAGAWGQAAVDEGGNTAEGGSPSIDVGTGIFNLPVFEIDKQLVVVDDDNGNGIIDVGDTIRYDLIVKNVGGVPILANRLKIWDNLPAVLDYVEGSTVISPELAPLGGPDPEPVPDDVAGTTAFPLDDGDSSNVTFDDPNGPTDGVDDGVWWNRRLFGGESFTISYEANVLEVPANNVVKNTALVTDGRRVDIDSDEFVIPELVAIGDRVWLDEDGDGVQDAGEDGIAGVIVTLTYTEIVDGTPVARELTTLTDNDGGYLFRDLPVLPTGETYTVTIAPPAGMSETYEEDGSLDNSVVLVSDPLNAAAANPLALQPGEEHTTTDFGLNWVPPTNTDGNTGVGAIGDRIWADVDGDGVQDPGEAGIAGVTVNLFTDPDGDGVYDTPAGSTVTDSSGHYIFDDLAAGSYVVTVDDATIDGVQTGDPDDFGAAAAAPDNTTTSPIVLAPGDVFVNADFGYQPTAGGALDHSIGDTVWLDGNGDGVIDAGEPRFGGVTVVLLDSSGDVVATTITDDNGEYLFAGVPNGDYDVWVNDTANILGEYAPISNPNPGDSSVDNVTDVTVAGADVLTADFGYAPPDADPDEGLIGDTVFLDADGDGTPDPGEGIEGVRLELYDEFGRLVGVTYTNENGEYAFGDLGPTEFGEYRVVVDESTLPAGVTNTVDPDGGNDSEASTPLGLGEQIYTVDFGYEPVNEATLSGTIWEDTDADGVLDGDEPDRFENVTVVLTQIVDEVVLATDPVTLETIELIVPVERVVATTTTDANGDYSFDGLTGGDYVVRVTDDANVVGGYWHSDAPAPGTDGQSQDDEGYAVTVPAGGTDTTADFGYYLNPGAVGDTVFEDLNANGVQDAGETGIEGAVVKLAITYPDGTVVLVTQVTDADGNYLFDNLLLDEDFNGDTATAGAAEPTYLVSVVALPPSFDEHISTHPESPVQTDSTAIGGDPASDLDADDPTGEPAFPGQGETDTTNDFGYVEQAAIGDFVWEDLDGDGVQGAGEPGLGGVTVNLLDDAGNVIDTATTLSVPTDLDGDGVLEPVGSYYFGELLPGTYEIEFSAPGDYVFSAPDQGPDDSVDSDADAVTGRTGPVSLGAGEYNQTVDAGLYEPVLIGDRVFDDANGNGVDDGASDPGIGGVTVRLYEDTDGTPGIDPATDTLVATTTTSAGDATNPAGYYEFADLAPGTYGVVVDTSVGPVAGYDQTVDPDGTLDNQTTTSITLASGEENLDQDFGYFLPAVIGDFVFYDANNNGVQDPGEAGINGVTVELVDATGAIVDSAVTGVDQPAGGYLFEDVPAGTYTVRIVTATLPTGFDISDGTVNTVDPDGPAPAGDHESEVTVAAGQSDLDQDFGYFDPGTIGDTVYNDVNGNGVQDAGEVGIPDVDVTLTDSTGATTTVTTGSSGEYLFTDLADGTYTVSVDTSTLPVEFAAAVNSGDPDLAGSHRDNPGDSESTVTLDAAGTILEGQSDLDQDFGYFIPGSIGDLVFEDLDNSGGFTAGEPGIPGVTVNLLDENGDPATDGFGNPITTTTDATGFYEFTNLPPGEYQVQVDETTLPGGAVQTFERAGDGVLDSTTTEDLAAGEDVTDVDFGYFRPATVGDYVWYDENANGVQDPDEVGVGGVTVELVDSDGIVFASTTTVSAPLDPNGVGFYEFTNVPAGDYTVRFSAPGRDFTAADQGGDDALDSDALADGIDDGIQTTASFSVAPGAEIETIDAGLLPSGSLGDFVWSDTNNDGVQDAGEPGIPGATVELLDGAGEPVLDNDLNPITTTTGADGAYLFENLPEGDYRIRVTPPASDEWLVSPQNVGDDATDSDIDATGVSDVVTVATGPVDTVDAGFVPAASLGDFVWQDENNNGIQDPLEPGVAGVTVNLLTADGTPIATTTTADGTGSDPLGFYEFTGLAPGDYIVEFIAPDGNIFSPADTVDDAVDSDPAQNGRTAPVTLAAGEDNPDVDAGLVETASLGDFVFNDADGDGAQDVGELGIAGVTVELLNAAGIVVQTTETSDGTDLPLGRYLFEDIAPGNYTVRFANTDGTTTYLFSPQNATSDLIDSDASPANGTTGVINLSPGETDLTVDAGLIVPAEITGTVYDDVNGDGSVLTPLPGVTVTLYPDTNGDGLVNDGAAGIPVFTSDGTDGNPIGSYTFGNLPPGDYIVVETNLPGYVDVSDQDETPDGDPFDANTDVDNRIAVQLVQGETDDGNDFVDLDPAGSISIEKSTNGVDADTAPGPLVAVGNPIAWTYTITNTGNIPLTGVSVTDNQGVVVTCGQTTLAVNESIVCTGSGIATAGQYTNIGLVSTNEGPNDTDPSNYFGVDADITIEKTVALGTSDAVDCSGVTTENVSGAHATPVTYCVLVTNTGNVPLADIDVVDPDLGFSTTIASLAPGASQLFEIDDTIDGDLVNTATATGDPVDELTDPANPAVIPPSVVPEQTDSDTASVNETPTFTVDKTNDANDDGTFSDTETQPLTPAVVPFRVVITNTGGQDLTFVSIADVVNGELRDVTYSCDPAIGGATAPTIAPGETIICTFSASVDLTVASSEIDVISVLMADETSTQQGTDTSTVLPPDRGEIGGVVYEDVNGDGDQQPAAEPGITDAVVTLTPPADINLGAGLGQPITLPVADGITDDLDGDGEVDPAGTYYIDNLLPGDYTIDVSLPDDYAQFEDPDGAADNTTMVLLPAGGSDRDNDFGYAQPTLDIEKSTNGEDADNPLGPFIAVDDDDVDEVTWTYVVTNTGVVPVTGVVVTDDPAPDPAPTLDPATDVDSDGILSPGEVWTFTASGDSIPGQFANTAQAAGEWTDSEGETETVASDEDPSHYYGVDASIEVQKTVALGADQTCPGTELATGSNGDAVTFCFEITNTGNTLLTGITLDDPTLGLTLADLTHVDGVAPTIDGLSLAAGESSVFSVNATITGDVINTATVTGTPMDDITDPGNPVDFPDGVVDDPTDDDTAEVAETPTFTVTKTNDADGDGTFSDTEAQTDSPNVEPFRVVITNDGSEPLTIVSITDSVDGVDRAFTDLACTNGAGDDVTVGGEIAVGDSVTCTFSFELDLRDGSNETDTISVVLADPEDNEVTETDTSTVNPPAPAELGGVVYVDTNGDGDQQPLTEPGIADATVTVTPPADVDLGAGPGNPIILNVSDGDEDVDGDGNLDPAGTYYLGSLLPGDYVVDVELPEPYQQFEDPDAAVDNQTTVSLDAGDSSTDNDFGYNQPSLDIEKATTTDLSGGPQDADLPTGPFATTDTTVTWTYTVTNTGVVPVSDVTVSDVPSPDPAPALDPSTDVGNDGILSAGETWVFLAAGDAVAGQFSNLADASGSWTDNEGVEQNVTSDNDPSNYFGVDASIDVQKTVASGAAAACPGVENVTGTNGDAVTYCFEITNDGNTVLQNVTLTDADLGITLADVTYVSGVQPFSGVLTLNPGESSVFRYSTTIDGDLVNTASVTGTPIDTFTNPNAPTPFPPDVVPAPEASDTASVDETPTFTVDKTNDADGDGTFSSVESATAAVSTVPFRVVIENTSGDPLTFVSIEDRVGGEIRAMVDLVCDPAVGEQIPAGGSATCTFTAEVDLTSVSAETDTISVVLTDGTTPVEQTNDSTVVGAADVAIEKTFVSATDADADGTYEVAYEVTVTNTGTTSDTYDLADTPDFDADLTITGGAAVPSSDGANTPAAPAAYVDAPWSLAVGQTIAPSETHTYVLTFTVDASAVIADPTLLDPCVGATGAPGQGLFNRAILTVDGAQIPAEDCGDLPLLEIDKTLDSAVDPDGDGIYVVTYTVSVANVGTADTSYGLTDAPSFDTDLTILAGSATVAPDTVPTPAAYTSSPWTLALDQAIAVGDIHTYTLTFNVDGTALVTDPSLLDPCDPTDPGPGEGLFNAATVTSDAGSVTAEDCGDPGVPAITIDKSFVSAADANADGTYDVIYTVTVANVGDGVGVYDLTDAPSIDDDLSVIGGSATAASNTDANTPTPGAFASPVWTLADGQAIAAGEIHTFTLTFQVDATAVVADPTVYDVCDAVDPVAGQGLFNEATLTYGTVEQTADDCGDLPLLSIDKTFVSAVDPDGDGVYTVTYDVVASNVGGVDTTYSLTDAAAPDSDITILGGATTPSTDGTNTPATPAEWVGNPWVLATDQPIAVGESHTYQLVFAADGSALVSDPAAYDPCDPAGPAAGQGLFNAATLTSDAGAITAEDCGELPIPVITIDKTFVSAIDADNDGVYDVTYTVVVANGGTGDGVYSAGDTPSFDADLSVVGGTATAVASDGGALSAPAAYVPTDGTWPLATDVALAAGVSHTYTLSFQVDASNVLDDPAAFAPCTDAPVAGEGLFNEATLTYDDVVRTDDDCGNLPSLSIDKQGPTISTDLDQDGEIDLGDTLEYTILVINSGATPLTGVTVVDSIIAAGDITCVRGDDSPFDHVTGDALAIGEVVTCTGTYVVQEGDVIDGEVVNVATADSNETPPTDDTVTAPIPPAVTIDKIVGAPVSQGDGQFQIGYTITVGNTGSAGTYNLVDELQFGGGITIDAASVTNTAPGGIPTNIAWNGTGNNGVTTGPVDLAYGAEHVYVVTVTATVDPVVATADSLTCPASGSGESGGFANTATVSMDDDIVSDDACTEPPQPDVEITKAITSGPTLLEDGNYSLTYQVQVRNVTDGVGTYDLTDELQYGAGITVVSASIISTDPAGIPIVAGWNGLDSTLAVDDAPITALEVHTFEVTVVANAIAVADAEAAACSTGEPPTAGGFLNVATVTSGADSATADDCAPVPAPGLSVNKLVSVDSPAANADGTYQITYTINVLNNGEGPGSYDLADTLSFGEGITVIDASVSSSDVPNDLSGWAGSGDIATGVPITGLNTHVYTVVVNASLAPTVTASARDCDLGTDETGTGFLNTATLTVGQETSDVTACVQAPAPAINITKVIPEGGLVVEADGTFSVTYDVTVTNTGGAAGQYELDDELTFGDGTVIATAVISETTPVDLVTSDVWNGVGEVDVTVAPVVIDGTDNAAGTQQHVYRIVVTGDVTGVVSVDAGDCVLDEGEAGTGFLNTATLTVAGVDQTDDACDPSPDPEISIDKSLTAGPTLTAAGNYALEYLVTVTNTGGFGTYDLADELAFGDGITVVAGTAAVANTSPGDGTVEAGAGWVGDAWNGVDATGITTGQPIPAGATQTYTVSVEAAIDPIGFDQAVDGVCPPPGSAANGGFLNVATLTVDGVDATADACAPTPAPELELTKTITSGPTDLGDGTYSITYDIVVANNGEGPDAYDLDDELRYGDGITIVDRALTNLLPGDISTNADWNGIDNLDVVNAQPIAGLDSHTYQVTVVADALTVLTVDAAACADDGTLEAGGLLNVALIGSSSLTGTADDCGEPALPDISVAKAIASGPTEQVGNPGVYDITYDVVVTNGGAGSGRYDLADDLRFGDGVTVISATVTSADVAADLSGWAGSGSIVTSESIAPAVSHTYTVSVTAQLSSATLAEARDCSLTEGEDGTGLLNVAAVSGPLVTPAEAEACAPLPNPSIDVSKTVVSGPTPVSGATYDITYEIVATNSGLGLGQYDLVDSLDFGDGITIDSASVTSGDVSVNDTWDGQGVVEVATDVDLDGGDSHTFTVTVRATAAAGITATASDCTLTDTEDGTGLLNTVELTVPGVDTVTDTACEEIPDPVLSIDKTVASAPTLNSDGTYTVSYTVTTRNTGDGPGLYELVDEPQFGPAISIRSATVSSASVTLPAPQSWDPQAGNFSVATGLAIAPGAAHTFTMTFVVDIDPVKLDGTFGTCVGSHQSSESEFFNRADIKVGPAVVDSDDACAPPPTPNLQIEKTASPTTLTPRADGTYTVEYTVKVSNTGGGPTTYTLTDRFAFAEGTAVLDVEVTSKPASATLIPGFNGDTRPEVADGSIAAGATDTYTIKVIVDVTGVRDDQAFDCTLDPGETGTGLLNRATVNPTDEACVEIPKLADLELTKAVSTDIVDVGSNVTFTLYVTNLGPANTTGVTVRDVLPAGLTYISSSGAGSYNPATGIWTIGDLDVSEAATIQIVVRVDEIASITNVAEVWTSDVADPDSTPGNGVTTEDDMDDATVTGRPVVIVKPPEPPPETLPRTGSSARQPITIAVWMLLGGLALTALAARRRNGVGSIR